MNRINFLTIIGATSLVAAVPSLALAKTYKYKTAVYQCNTGLYSECHNFFVPFKKPTNLWSKHLEQEPESIVIKFKRDGVAYKNIADAYELKHFTFACPDCWNKKRDVEEQFNDYMKRKGDVLADIYFYKGKCFKNIWGPLNQFDLDL